MYCTIDDVRKILPDNITIGDQNLGTPSPGTSTTKRDRLTPDEVIHFIKLGGQDIDAKLRSFYIVPLRRNKAYETPLMANVSAGTNITLNVYDSGAFAKYQTVEIIDGFNVETTTVVEDVTNINTLVVESLINNFTISNASTVSVLEFPDPIPTINAKFAASYAYDQLFSADQAPNVSTYGDTQRQQAFNQLDSILDGTISLFGQNHSGRRFIRGSLWDAYSNPTNDFSFGREKPSA